MPGTNLTRDEAETRAGHLTVTSYAVHLDLTGSGPDFGSTTTVRFGTSAPSAPTWLDLIAAEVSEVTVNGTAADPATCYDGARVGLRGLAEDNEVRVVARCSYMTTGEGLHRFVDPVDSQTYLYTQFEVPDSRRVFAVFEQPDLKAEFTFTVDAPAGWEVVSSSPVARQETLPDGATRWEFEPTPRISSYVTAVCAGPYHVVRSEYADEDGRIVPLGLYCRRSLSDHLDADALLEVTRAGFAFFEKLFDHPYPFAKYDQLFVPEFNAGAMENVGCVTYRDEYLFRSRVTDAAYERRAETVLHEMAHMWFGDLVTMRWWNDLWLNESFATWASVLAQAEATRWTEAWTTFASAEKLWALRQDQLPSTHPVSADIADLADVEVNFDGITYAKGASVLKQLVAWVGRDEFVAGLRRYIADNAWGNTTLADLFAELEAESGRDLGTWEQEWLLTAGANTLRPVLGVDDGDEPRYTSVVIEQEAPPEHPTLRSHRVAVGLYDARPEGLVLRDRVEIDVTGRRTDVPALVGERVADLVLVNDDDLTFAKIRFDSRSLDTLEQHIDDLRDSLPRALAWTGLTDMLRAAELPARRYVDMVLTGVASETDMPVVQTLLLQGRGAVEQYSDPAGREGLRSRWASGLHGLASRAEPGSDLQLALTRAWATAAGAPADLEEVEGLLDGSRQWPGLVVDTDLRWHLLQRLVVHGAAGDDAIAAELERDPTATGRQHAALARAARPTEQAKQEAWDSVMDPSRLSNAEMEATVAGFVLPEQRELLRPFVDRYFDAVLDVWEQRTFHTAERIIVGLYPRVVVEDTLVERTRRWAEQPHVPRAVRRMLAEGASDLERAVRAQACDAAS